MAFTIKAETRTEKGKSAMRSLRRAGQVPAVLYGKGETTQNLLINSKEFSHLLEKIKGHSPIIDLEVGGNPLKCVIKLIQRNPVTLDLMHVDFQTVHATEKISVAVPIILKGSPIGVKEGGILEHLLRQVPVKAQLDKIPEHIEVDVTGLKIGHSIHIGNLKLEGVEFSLPADATIVSVLAPRKIEEVVAPVAAAAEEEMKEPEVITEKKKEEEEPAEEGKEKKGAEKGAKEKEKEAAPKKEKEKK